MRAAIFIGLLAVAGVAPVQAQIPAATAASAATPISDMEAVVVTGVQPGPGMWKVSKGDHVLWVLGVQSPLPKHMEWRSPTVEATIAQSQEVIDPPQVGIGMNFGGMFRAMFALPTLLKVRKNSDDKSLQDVLPPDLYARWAPLKARYLGADRDVEQLRPIFAAQVLYQEALAQAGLGNSGEVIEEVDKQADRLKVRRVSTALTTTIDHPKAVAKSFARSPVDDIACLRGTLDLLDSNVSTAVARANAWAVGDVETLSGLARRPNSMTCLKAISQTEVARSLGLDDVDAKLRAKWLSTAESALTRNESTFAMLSIDHLLSADSYLVALQAKGYTVEPPQ